MISSVIEDGLEFLAIFVMVAAPVFLLLGAFHTAGLNEFAARSSALLLGQQGASAVHENGEWFVRSARYDAWINDLCAGVVEVAVLCGAISASADRSKRQRAKGIVAGIAAILAFNPLRIAFTLQQAGSLQFAFVHEVLFRLALVVFIVSFYAIWYAWTRPAGFRTLAT